MNVLVTGSAGFLGRHLVAALRERGNHVVEYDIKAFEPRDCLPMFRHSERHYDLVFHCAAEVGGREGIDFNAARLGAVNLQLDGGLFEWALRTRPGRVVYFSSAAAYPTSLQGDSRVADTPRRLREGHARPGLPGMPDETYGWAKLTGELLADRVRKAGVPVTVVRPFSMYDFDQDDDYPFPQFAKRAVRHDDPFVVWGDGQQVRDWLHIDDAVRAIFALIAHEIAGPVNLGTGVGTTMDELARIAMRCAGYEAPIHHLLDKPVGVRRRVADVSALRSVYEPQITVEQGMRRAVKAVSEACLTLAS